MKREEKRTLFLQLLLDSYLPNSAQNLWKKLPVNQLEIPKNKINCPANVPIRSNLEFLQKIHYSWMAAYISTLPAEIQKGVANAFPDFNKIIKVLNVEKETKETHGNLDPYLHNILIEKIGLKEHMPICFLPKSSFEELLKWDRNKILLLIDLLALADAGKELKQIVDRNRLLLIYSALGTEQKNYLKHCMLTKHVSCDIKLNLRSWQGTKENLKVHIHKLGLDLFAKGLHQEHEDFIFYLSHILDVGRGKPLIEKIAKAKTDENKDLYYKNLLQAYKFLSYEKT